MPSSEPGMRREMPTAIAFVWTFLVAVLLMAGVAFLARFGPQRSFGLATLGAWDALVCIGVTYAVLRVHFLEGTGPVALGLRPSAPLLSFVGCLLGLSLSVSVTPLQALVEYFWPLSEAELLGRAELFRLETPAQLAVTTLSAACLVPLGEELFFRGALYTGLRSEQSAALAASMSGVCFVLVHLNLRDWLPLLLVTIVLSLLRALSGSLLPCLGLHVTFNAVSIALVASGWVPAYGRLELAWPWVVLAWAATLALVVWARHVAKTHRAALDARKQEEHG